MPESAKRKKASKAILDYVIDQQKLPNPEDTKAHVMRYLAKESLCSEPVGHSLIIELVDGGKLRVIKDKPNSQVHHLVINDENEFHTIGVEIDKLILLANNLTKVVTRKAEFLNHITTRMPNTPSFSIDLSNLAHLAQQVLYGRLTTASNRIQNNIKSTNDREVLYLRLVQVLNASNKLNQILFPEIEKGVKETMEKLSLKSNKINTSNKSNRVKLDPEFEKQIPRLALEAMRRDPRYSTIQDIINAVRESF